MRIGEIVEIEERQPLWLPFLEPIEEPEPAFAPEPAFEPEPVEVPAGLGLAEARAGEENLHE